MVENVGRKESEGSIYIAIAEGRGEWEEGKEGQCVGGCSRGEQPTAATNW